MSLRESETSPPLRSDAARNRQRILGAAARLIGERGLDIGHDEIARAAEVGVGTVYRRFPTREALFDALYFEQLEAMVEVAEEAAQVEDAWEGLQLFLERTLEQQAANRGLRELLIGHSGTTDLARSAQARIGPLVAVMVGRARQTGKMSKAVGATDVAMVPVMVNAIMRASRDVTPDLWRRWLAIILEGMASGPRRAELPGAPPGRKEVAALIGGAGSRPR